MSAVKVSHPFEPDTFVAVPQDGHLRLHVYELDGSAAEVEFLEQVPFLLSAGQPSSCSHQPGTGAVGGCSNETPGAVPEEADMESDDPVFGYLEVSDDVVFFLQGRHLKHDAALEYLTRGLIDCIREGVQAADDSPPPSPPV